MQKLAGKSLGGSPGKRETKPCRSHCTGSWLLLPNKHKEDEILEPGFILRTLTPPTGVIGASNKETLLRGVALLVNKAMEELTECAAFAPRVRQGWLMTSRSNILTSLIPVFQLTQASAEGGAAVNHTRFLQRFFVSS